VNAHDSLPDPATKVSGKTSYEWAGDLVANETKYKVPLDREKLSDETVSISYTFRLPARDLKSTILRNWIVVALAAPPTPPDTMLKSRCVLDGINKVPSLQTFIGECSFQLCYRGVKGGGAWKMQLTEMVLFRSRPGPHLRPSKRFVTTIHAVCHVSLTGSNRRFEPANPMPQCVVVSFQNVRHVNKSSL